MRSRSIIRRIVLGFVSTAVGAVVIAALLLILNPLTGALDIVANWGISTDDAVAVHAATEVRPSNLINADFPAIIKEATSRDGHPPLQSYLLNRSGSALTGEIAPTLRPDIEIEDGESPMKEVGADLLSRDGSLLEAFAMTLPNDTVVLTDEIGWVNVERLNLYGSRSLTAPVLETLPITLQVRIIGLNNDWVQVLTTEGEPAWAQARQLEYEKVFRAVEGERYTVGGSTVLYAEPSENSEQVADLPRDSKVLLCEASYDWFLVELEDGTRAYVEPSKLAEESQFSPLDQTMYVWANHGYVFADSDDSEPAIASISKRTAVKVTGEAPSWYRIIYEDKTAYIGSYALKNDPPPIPTPTPTPRPKVSQQWKPYAGNAEGFAKRVVEIALGMQGPQGHYDCSTFVYTVLKRAGYSNPPSKVSGYYNGSHGGQRVSLANMRPGDVLVYDSYGHGNPTHVGIYIGNGKAIHCNTRRHRIMIQEYHIWYYPILAVRRFG